MSDVLKHSPSADLGIRFSEAATARVQAYLADHDGKGVRLSVKKTGCSGLSYVIDYVTAASEGDLVFSLTQGLQVFVDQGSYPFLKGSRVDYVKQGLNHKFVFDNPNQTGQCGCGESFTIG